ESKETVAAFRLAFARSGMRGFWQQKLVWAKEKTQHQYFPPYQLARIYARLGDADQAFLFLEKSYQEHSPYLLSLKVDPLLDNLRGDPGFADLVLRGGLSR